MPFLSVLQDTLVPPITYAGARLEAHGQSIPKDDTGGGVSGHGLRAGILMGMIKTAVRYGLLLGQPLAKLLDDINRVLPSVKEPSMYATLAALRFDGSTEVEYISAGHVPLLHYRRRHGDVVRYCTPQFPLGLLAGASYTPRRIRAEAGDIFALVTDGVVEIGDDQDVSLGLERVAEVLRDRARCPLEAIVEAVHAQAGRGGEQQDDRTVLLGASDRGER